MYTSGNIAPVRAQGSGAIRQVNLGNTLLANDDDSSPAIPLGIGDPQLGINFFGQYYSQVFVNNNGNLTFSSAFGEYTPNGLAQGVGQPIIAPFFADVDTTGTGSGLVQYGNASVDVGGVPHNAFVANYFSVGYFDANTDKLNTFQVALIDRADTGTGNFDIEFNYGNILWETGDASDGINGFGGTPAAAGYSNGQTGATGGSGPTNVYYQFPGSLVSGSLINGGPNSLNAHTVNSNVPGRYVFAVRNGVVSLVISTNGLPSATVNTPYTFQMTAAGGSGNELWSGTNLPPGLTISSAGVISGTPTAAGNFSNTQITVVDNQVEQRDSKTYLLQVFAAAPPPSGLTLSGPLDLGTFALGSPVAGALTVSGGTPPYQFTATGVPAGMTASGTSISGIPANPGSYFVAITVTDTKSHSVTSVIRFSVFGISPALPPPAVTSSPYSFFFTADGGTPPYSYTATGLPPGFSFGSNGFLNGTPRAAGSYTLTVTAVDAHGATSTASFPFTVKAPAPLNVNSGALTDLTVGIPSSQVLSATGGAAPYAWTLVGGALPDGFGLRGSGTVFGSATHAGSYSFTAKATDVSGASATGTFTVNVKSPPVLITTPSPLPAGMVSVEYPQQVITASGGTGPYTFALSDGSLPAGLALSSGGAITGTPASGGNSTFTVKVTDATGQTGTASLQIPVRSFSPDLLLSSGSLSFSLPAGSVALPDLQTVAVQSTDVTKVLRYSTAITSSSPWLSVTEGGSTPGSFNVALTSSALSLAASTTPYEATVAVTCIAPSPCAGNSQNVSVTLLVKSTPPQLTILTDLVSFNTLSTNPQSSLQGVGVQNAGGGSIGFASVTCAAPWCKVTQIPAALGGGAVGSILITADPAGLDNGGLNPGYYETTLTIVSSAGTTAVPVSFFISAHPSIALNPAGVQVTMPVGGQAAVPVSAFLVSVSGAQPVQWSASVLPGAPWLKLGTASGTSTGTAPGSVSFSIDPVAAAALSAQAYYGTIRVTSTGIANSPQDFQVVLNVTPATDKLKPNPAPAGLIFITSATAVLPPQTVQVFASSAVPVNYQTSAATSDGRSWLSVSPATGTTSASAPAQSTVTVSPAGLQAGVYRGTVSYSFSSAAVRSVNVTLIVQTAVPASDASGAGSSSGIFTPKADPAPCTPRQLIPTQTGLVTNFSAPAAWPTPLEITLTSDCGTAVTNGQIVATFSNGDPPLALNVSDAGAGKYAGTWTPRHTSSQVAVKATASAVGLPSATIQITGAVVPNVAPVLTHNGTLHIFTPQVGGPLAPGTIAQIYGTGLASQTLAGSTIPLATSLAGTSVLVGGVQAPLFFVSPGQINAQIPFELNPGQPYQVIVNNNGALTTPETVQISGVTPGAATLPSGYANAQHVADGSLVTVSSPAKPGEYVVLYLAGLGPTTIPVATGAGAPSGPLAETQIPPAITLNGEPVTVLFAGLTPGLAGLYQIDLQVPADATDGDLTLSISQSGFQAASLLLPVRH